MLRLPDLRDGVSVYSACAVRFTQSAAEWDRGRRNLHAEAVSHSPGDPAYANERLFLYAISRICWIAGFILCRASQYPQALQHLDLAAAMRVPTENQDLAPRV